MKREPGKSQLPNKAAIGIGLTLGIVVGAIFGNVGLGVAFGLIFSAVIGFLIKNQTP